MANSHTSVFLFNSKYGSYNGFRGSMTRAAKRRRSQAIYKKNWRIYKRAAFQSTINNMFSLKKGLTMAGCLTIGNSFRIVPGSGRCLETYRKLLMGFLFRWRDNLYDVKSFFLQEQRREAVLASWSHSPQSFLALSLYWPTKAYFLTLGKGSGQKWKVSDHPISNIQTAHECPICLEWKLSINTNS